jgi:hypothetical protein
LIGIAGCAMRLYDGAHENSRHKEIGNRGKERRE